MGTIKQYPQVTKVVSFYSLAGTIQCSIFSLIMERNINAWKLKLNMELLLIIITVSASNIVTKIKPIIQNIYIYIIWTYLIPLLLSIHMVFQLFQAIFGSVIRSTVHISCAKMKGPLYVPMFKPFGIVFATTFGLTFFTNALHYGR